MVTMSEPSVKLLVVAETPSVLDRLSEILAPCAEVDTAAGREDASRLAGEKLHDAILWEVAASDADACNESFRSMAALSHWMKTC